MVDILVFHRRCWASLVVGCCSLAGDSLVADSLVGGIVALLQL
jgi:hypothetical protein